VTDREHIVRLRTALRRAAGVIDGLQKEILKRNNVQGMPPSGEAVMALAHSNLSDGESWEEACAYARKLLEEAESVDVSE
jgi:hypothetical protein